MPLGQSRKESTSEQSSWPHGACRRNRALQSSRGRADRPQTRRGQLRIVRASRPSTVQSTRYCPSRPLLLHRFRAFSAECRDERSRTEEVLWQNFDGAIVSRLHEHALDHDIAHPAQHTITHRYSTVRSIEYLIAARPGLVARISASRAFQCAVISDSVVTACTF